MTYAFTEKGPLSVSDRGAAIAMTGSAVTVHVVKAGGRREGRTQEFEELHVWAANSTASAQDVTIAYGAGGSQMVRVSANSKAKIIDGEIVLGGLQVSASSAVGVAIVGYFQRAQWQE